MLKQSHSNYSATIQIRPFDQKIYDYILNQIRKSKINIVQQNKLKKGIDIFIDSHKIIKTLGRRLKRNFKGELKITYSLHTFDAAKGKKIYRSTLLFRTE